MDAETVKKISTILEEKKQILIPLMIALIFLIGSSELLLGFSSGVMQEGRLAFFFVLFLRVGFVTAAFFVVRILILEVLLRGNKWGAGGIRGFLAFPLAVIALALGVLFIINPVRDFVYLNEPPGVTLQSLEFDEEKPVEDATFYKLSGAETDGTVYEFNVNRDTYEEGVSRRQMNDATRAEVSYLPHSKFVISLHYIDYGRADNAATQRPQQAE